MNDLINEENNIFDTVIIGGGPAGAIAGVYAARKKLKTLIITKDFGGQSVVSDTIENWPGEIEIKGSLLAKKIADQVKHYKSDNFVIKEYTTVKKIEETNQTINNKKIFLVTDSNENQYLTKTVLIATGAQRRKLPAKNADIFEHKGLTYCASCDGPMFTNKDVVVIGGGNSAFESASQLVAYTKSVTILQRDKNFIAEPTMQEAVLKNPKVTGITGVNVTEILGDNFVTGLKYEEIETKKEHELKVDGIFVEIGLIPATSFVENDFIEKNKYGQITINHQTCQTSKQGIWAAGDCTDIIYRQNTIALGDATKAIEDLYQYLQK